MSTSPTCPRCRTANDAGMNFCKMCGSILDAPLEPSNPPSRVSGTIAVAGEPSCDRCGARVAPGFAFCQRCGARISSATPLIVDAQAPAHRRGKGSAARSADASRMGSAAKGVAARPASAPIAEPLPWGRLVAQRDGADAEPYPLSGDRCDLGRTEGAITIPGDAHLAARHARFTVSAGLARLRALDDVNGVYVRVRGTHALRAGDHILFGQQLLRFELVPREEAEASELVELMELGVLRLGSHNPPAWARLRQVTAAGSTRDIYHLGAAETRFGRGEGEHQYPEDQALSPLHLAIRRHGEAAELLDLSPDGGTFLRLRGEHELTSGDVLRMGEQMFRFEAL